jgi:hypothetical protein
MSPVVYHPTCPLMCPAPLLLPRPSALPLCFLTLALTLCPLSLALLQARVC